MTIRNLISAGVLAAGLAVTASAQPQQYGPHYSDRREVERDLRRRDDLSRRVERDRRDVEHERRELRHSNWYSAGHESRELRRAQERLDRDRFELRQLDERIARESGGRYR